MSSYTEYSRQYSSSKLKPIIHNGGSNSSSRSSVYTSYGSSSSSGGRNSSSSSSDRSSSGYNRVSYMDERTDHKKYRVSDNGMYLRTQMVCKVVANRDTDRKYIDSSSRGNVQVINHDKGRWLPDEPRSSESSSSQHHPSKKHRESHHSSKSSSKSSSKRNY